VQILVSRMNPVFLLNGLSHLLKLMAGDVGSAENQLLSLQSINGVGSVQIRVMKYSPFPVMDFERKLFVSHSTYCFCSTADRTK
jgi:hypothetical protein